MDAFIGAILTCESVTSATMHRIGFAQMKLPTILNSQRPAISSLHDVACAPVTKSADRYIFLLTHISHWHGHAVASLQLSHTFWMEMHIAHMSVKCRKYQLTKRRSSNKYFLHVQMNMTERRSIYDIIYRFDSAQHSAVIIYAAKLEFLRNA